MRQESWCADGSGARMGRPCYRTCRNADIHKPVFLKGHSGTGSEPFLLHLQPSRCIHPSLRFLTAVRHYQPLALAAIALFESSAESNS
jgi:hypothetical protein